MVQKEKTVQQAVYYGLVFVVVIALMSFLLPERYFTRFNLQSMAFQVPEFGILSLGMMLAMLAAGIDLSIVANANLAGIISASVLLKLLATHSQLGDLAIISVTVIIACLAGALGGFLNGFLISIVRIPPILATLGTMNLFEGLGTVITGGRAVRSFPYVIQMIANDTFATVPYSFYMFIFVVLAMALFLTKTPLGFEIRMFGCNQQAARYSGFNNEAILLKVYTISGLLAGVASLIMMSRFNSVKVGYGNSYLLQTVLVAILGGTNPDGGEADVLRVFFSVLILQCIASGFNILGFTNYIRNVIYGSTLIIALVTTILIPQILSVVKEKRSAIN